MSGPDEPTRMRAAGRPSQLGQEAGASTADTDRMHSDRIVPRRHSGSPRCTVSGVVDRVLQSALAQLQPPATPGPNEALRRACRQVLEQLWGRREALARSLRRAGPPLLAAAPSVLPRTARVRAQYDRCVVELDASTTLCALRLSGALAAARLLRAPAHTLQVQQWPFTAHHWAAALRRIAKLASPVHEVRLELVRLGSCLLCPHFVDAWRHAAAKAQTTKSVGLAQAARGSGAEKPRLQPAPLRSPRRKSANHRPSDGRIWSLVQWCRSAFTAPALLGCGGGAESTPCDTAAVAPSGLRSGGNVASGEVKAVGAAVHSSELRESGESQKTA